MFVQRDVRHLDIRRPSVEVPLQVLVVLLHAMLVQAGAYVFALAYVKASAAVKPEGVYPSDCPDERVRVVRERTALGQ